MCITVHDFFVKGAAHPLFLVYLSFILLFIGFPFIWWLMWVKLNIVRVICFFVSVVLLSSFCVAVLSDFVQGRACIDTKPFGVGDLGGVVLLCGVY